jgi:Resolvase, N terminal domain
LSGASLDRPTLQEPLGDLRGGKIDVIVAYKVDRLTRSLADFLQTGGALQSAFGLIRLYYPILQYPRSMGRIFDDRGNRMTPSHSNEEGVRYRYYVSHAVL